MKKYSSYFNKRYFPEQEEQEETPLSDAADSQEEAQENIGAYAESVDSESSAMAATPAMPSAPKPSAFSFASFDMPEEEPLDAPLDAHEPVPVPVAMAPVFSIPEEPVRAEEAETTVISESAVINGEMSVSGNIRMYGKIKGNLTATGNLEIKGKVIGNLAGNDVELSRCELKGDINASGFTFMDKDSIMIGNLSSNDVTLDGKVKGDVSAIHKVYVRSNAVIVGNVRAAVIAIDEGAALQGQVIIASKESDGLALSNEEG